MEDQIDELHQDTIWDYSDKALTSLDKSRKVGYKNDFSPKPGKKAAAARKTFDKRDRGLAMASKRLGGVFDEETQIDELYGKGSLEKIRSHHQGEANRLAQGGSKQEKKMGALGRLHRDSEARETSIRHHHGKAKKARGLMSKLALREDTFAGATVFEVSSHTFHNAKMEKRKGKHWRTYLDECDELSEIREYANKHPSKPIVLQNRNTNEMVYVRYGKAR